ncbi:MAG: gliding motility-associated C-terminal domain-containing protein, partial [Bernardetiaceae bacterium]|nr:gliding motility-associated C-terminal domain-containing protein [Bernardetiaceae bacterium]
VIDDIAPTISCPANINVGITNNIGVCGKVVNYDLPTFDDNCADATLTMIDGLASGEIFPLGETVVTYRVTDASGNFAECSFTVTVTTPPVVIAANRDPNLCVGESITLSASPFGTGLGITYQWYKDGVAIPDATEQFLTLTGDYDGAIIGTYTALVDNGCPAMSENSIEINVFPTPAATIIAPVTDICDGEEIILNGVDISHADLTVSYQWFRNGTPIPLATGGTLTVTDPGDYTVRVTNEIAGCDSLSAAVTLNFTDNPEISVSVPPAYIVCAPETTIGNDLPEGYGYVWEGPAIVSDPVSRIITVADSGVYTVRIIDLVTFCESTFETYVVRNPEPTVGVRDTLVCEADLPGKLIARDIIHGPEIEYEWFASGDTTAVLGTGDTLNVDTQGFYMVRVTNTITGCVAWDTAYFDFKVNPNFEIRGHEEGYVCNREDTLYIEATNLTNMQIQWSGPGIVSIGGDSLSAVVNASGVYSVTVTDLSSSAECSTTKTINVTINPQPMIPDALIDVSSSLACEDETVSLDAFDPSHAADAIYTWRNLSTGDVVSDASSLTVSYADHGGYNPVNYSITITYPLGDCESSDTVSVQFERKSNVSITAQSDSLLCLGEEASFTASGAEIYNWRTADGATTWNNTNELSFTADSVGVYTIIVEGVYEDDDEPRVCGSSLDTIVFRVRPQPIAIAPADRVVCEDDSLRFNGFNETHTPQTTYEWRLVESEALLSETNILDFSASDVADATYEWIGLRLTVTDSLTGCSHSDTFQVRFERKSFAEILPYDSATCSNSAIELEAEGGSDFRWRYAGEEFEGNTFVFSSDSVGWHRIDLSAWYANGCDTTEAVAWIYVNEPPVVSAHSLDTVNICADESVTLTPSGAVSYEWLHAPNTFGEITVSPSGPTLYIVKGTDSLGCVDFDSVFVNITPTFDLAGPISVCEGTLVTIGDTAYASANPNASFFWLPTGQTSPMISVNQSGEYTVEVTIDSCTFTRSVTVDFKSLPQLSVVQDTVLCFEFGDDQSFAGGETHTIGVGVTNYDPSANYLYVWTNEDSVIVGTNDSLEISEPGVYTVKVIAMYGFNCENVAITSVEEACDSRIFIPQAFSPNEDGLNDYFQVFGRHIGKFKMMVFNRWGEVVHVVDADDFDSLQETDFWDGRHNGQKVPTGTYVWTITYEEKLPSGAVLKKVNGALQIVR